MMNPLQARIICATIALVATISNVHNTVVNKCDVGLTPEVNITDCDIPPCVLHLESEVGFEMKFKSPKYLENIAPQVNATIGEFQITYPITQNDACQGITNVQCPLAEGEKIEYNFAMNLSTLFPELSLRIKFAILDNDAYGQPVVCFEFDCETRKD